MAEYRATESAVVIRTRDGASIPDDPKNRDRQEYDTWVAKGGVPDPAPPPPPPPPPPQGWTPYQIVIALEKMGVAEAILSRVDEITKAKFFAGSFILETEPLLIGALNAVGKTIDDLKKVAIEA